MRTILAVMLIALLGTAAHAEGRRGNRSSQPSTEAAKKREAADKAYKAALDKIPNQPKADPWGNVRPGPKVRPAKGQTKSQKK
jgi:hypothetical protein